MTIEMNGPAIVAAFERADDEAIEAWVAALPRERVVETLHVVTELRRALYVGERMLKSRVVGDEILSVGESWTSHDGHEFMWGGDRERVCSDPAALREQLSALPLNALARRALAEAFKEQPLKVYLTALDRIANLGGNEADRVIRSFVTWKESGAKLRPLDGKDGQ